MTTKNEPVFEVFVVKQSSWYNSCNNVYLHQVDVGWQQLIGLCGSAHLTHTHHLSSLTTFFAFLETMLGQVLKPVLKVLYEKLLLVDFWNHNGFTNKIR